MCRAVKTQSTRKSTTARINPAITEKQKDDSAITLIRGLDALMAYACAAGLGNAERIIASAKENIVYWVADQNFFESAQDRFIQQHTSRTPSLYGIMPEYFSTPDNSMHNELLQRLLTSALAA